MTGDLGLYGRTGSEVGVAGALTGVFNGRSTAIGVCGGGKMGK